MCGTCTNSAMATSITISSLSSSPSTIINPNSNLKIPQPSQIPTILPPLKLLCNQSNLKLAFKTLSNIISNQNPPHTNLDEPYSLVLELCAKTKSLSQVKQIHSHVLKSDSVSDVSFLSTKLVFAYGKCGSVSDARKLFDEMPDRSVFAWNAMIGAFITNGDPFGGLRMFCKMHTLGILFDASTFTSVAKACGEIRDVCLGSEIHCLAIKMGFSCNGVVINSIMAMYVKCNDSNSATLLFERLSEKEDVVSWNSIISAYSGSGKFVEALTLFKEMQMAGVVPTTYTLVAALQACEEPSFLIFGKEIHAVVLKSLHYLDIYVANALVVMYTRCGKMVEASRIFKAISDKDNVSWNSILSGFVQNGLHHEALNMFYEMQHAGQKPDQCSVITMAAVSGRLGNLLNGMEIHAYAMKNGIDSDLQVGNTLMDMYAKCGKMNYVESVFNRMRFKDSISCTTIIAAYAQNEFHLRAIRLFRELHTERTKADSIMIGSILLACGGLMCIPLVKETHAYIVRRGLSDLVLHNLLIDIYGKCGCIDYARRVFKFIEVKNVVTWTSIISCLVHGGLANDALEIFISMKYTDIEPDSIALLSILSAAANLSALRKGKEIHGFLVRKGFTLEGPIASSLVNMYASCGTIENSYKVFNSIQNKDLVLWTSMINAYGMHGFGNEAVSMFKRMEGEKIIPDHVCFLALLYACSHALLVDEGKGLFEVMKNEYRLDPWLEHCACLVDLLGRANYLEEAFQFVESMQIEPNAAIWCSLLGACRIHSNKELGTYAAKKLLELDLENAGNYVLVSNFYASIGRWEDMEGVRMKMRGKGLKKEPACSWTEIGNRVHTFTARDRSHPECDEIYKKLTQVTEKLEREGGYVAETKYVLHNIEESEKVKLLYGHSERLAIAYNLLKTPERSPIRITKNLRVCNDCHTFSKLVAKCFEREIIVRDANRFHHFRDGVCSCGDLW